LLPRFLTLTITQRVSACKDAGDVPGERQEPGGEGANQTAKPDSRRHVAVLTWVWTRGRRFARWFVLLFIASLIIPALTKQWNDRKQELEVKQRLLSDVVKATTDAVYGAQDVSLQADPEQQRQARSQLLGAWLRGRSTLETPMLVYFDPSDAADHWRGRGQLGLRNAVLLYVLMVCCDREERDDHIRMLRNYLPPLAPEDIERLEFDPWNALRCGPQEACTLDPRYRRAYTWLGNRILEQRLVLRDQLLAANGKGFSSGWRDFVADLNPVG
jgi:hypothetical protein